MRVRAAALGSAVGAGLAQWGPALTSLPHARRTLLPRLSGIVSAPHVSMSGSGSTIRRALSFSTSGCRGASASAGSSKQRASRLASARINCAN